MAQYESITYSRQDNFNVEDELRSENFELEIGESATKAAYLLCGKAALIGEFVISDEGTKEILENARRIFWTMCAGRKDNISLTDGRIMVVACVLLTRNCLNTIENGNEQDQGEIWQSILKGLNFPEISAATGCGEQLARRYLCDILKNRYNIRFFAEGGQKYYNTLRLHALAPEWAIKNLFSVLYGFYHKNLECSYFTGSNVAEMFVSGIRRRWEVSQASGAKKQAIQSDRLSSSLRELFMQCPMYMAAVCDALLERIDNIAQGNFSGLSDNNRWDMLLQEWYQNKTASEKSRMLSDRKATVRRKVVDRKENIRPEYSYENGNIYLTIPGIRLPEIQEAPTLELYQNDQLVYKQRLIVYGDDVLLSTRAHRIPLNQIAEINWKKRFCFMIRITSGQNEIYCSGGELFREYLCFNLVGNESRLTRTNQVLRLIVRKSAKLVILDPENRYSEEAAPYRKISLWANSIEAVQLNGIDILEDNHSEKKIIWAYITPEYDARVSAKYDENIVSVYSERPILHVVVRNQDDAKNYQIIINDAVYQLYQFPYENSQFKILLPAIMERRHFVQLKDFSNSKTIFCQNYTIVPGLRCEFDKPFYLDRDISGRLYITSDRRRFVHSFQLEQGVDKVCWKMADLDYEITVPKVFAEIADKNAFYLEKSTWYENLKDSFLTVRTPENVSCAVIFENRVISPNFAGDYEIGAAIDNRNIAQFGALLGMIVSAPTWQLEWKLTFVHFKEHFENNPIIQDGRKILWNPIESCYIGGDEEPIFRLELENDQQNEPFMYSLRMKSDIIEKHFPCKTGTYKYTLWLTERKKIFTNLPDLQMAVGEITVEDPPEERFQGKHIILTHAYYRDPQKDINVNAKMKYNGALIDDICYEGIRKKDGKMVHEYSGYMYFKTAGGWRPFSEDETDHFEKINPMFFTIEDEEYVVACLEDDAPLMLNTSHAQQINQYSGVQIFSRKDELTHDEQARYLAFADKFKFIERNN